MPCSLYKLFSCLWLHNHIFLFQRACALLYNYSAAFYPCILHTASGFAYSIYCLTPPLHSRVNTYEILLFLLQSIQLPQTLINLFLQHSDGPAHVITSTAGERRDSGWNYWSVWQISSTGLLSRVLGITHVQSIISINFKYSCKNSIATLKENDGKHTVLAFHGGY